MVARLVVGVVSDQVGVRVRVVRIGVVGAVGSSCERLGSVRNQLEIRSDQLEIRSDQLLEWLEWLEWLEGLGLGLSLVVHTCLLTIKEPSHFHSLDSCAETHE